MPSARKPGGARPKRTRPAAAAAAQKAPKRRATPAAARASARAAAETAGAQAAAERAGASAPSPSGTDSRADRPAGRTIVIEQYASGIGCQVRQKKTLRALGLRRPRQRVVRPDNEAVRGMVLAIPHLVRIVEGGHAA